MNRRITHLHLFVLVLFGAAQICQYVMATMSAPNSTSTKKCRWVMRLFNSGDPCPASSAASYEGVSRPRAERGTSAALLH